MVYGVKGVLGNYMRTSPPPVWVGCGTGRGLWAYLIFLKEICLIFFS